MFPVYYGYWEYWELRHKVTFDGEAKLILINPGITEIDVLVDIYSDWKEWSTFDDNTKFLQALSATGGDPLPGVDLLGSTFFLENGWKIETWGGDQTLTINGNIYSRDGSPVFIPTPGPYTILIVARVSNLVDKINTDSNLVADDVTTIVTDVIQTEATNSIAPAVWDTLPTGEFTTIVTDVVQTEATNSIAPAVWAALPPDDIAAAVWNALSASYNLINSMGALIQGDVLTRLDELHKIHGLDIASPLSVSPTERSVDTIVQDIDEDSGTGNVTVTRTS